MRLIQVTLGAAATQVTTGKIYSPAVFFQNNASHNCRVGDNTVSSTKGIQLNLLSGGGGGSLTIYRADNRIPLFEYYISGTQGDIIDVLYE